MKLLNFFIILLLSFLIGTAVGHILSILFPGMKSLSLFVNGFVTGFEPIKINLKVLDVELGIHLLINGFSWAGLLISSVILLIKEAIKQ